jgi:uncharacterized membrane protein YqhA
MSIKQVTEADERKLFWLAVIHMVFVGSSVLLALSDWISGAGGHGKSTDKTKSAEPASADKH